MKLSRLKAAHFRNLAAVDIEPGAQFNLFFGANGSGKTSILETICFLGLGRSFRTSLTSRIINYDQESLSVFGQIERDGGIAINTGIEKNRQGKIRIKVGNEMVASLAELARALPLQLINPDSYSLLTGGPRPRREFLDWGVFHVEQSFFPLWQRYQRALKQRNASLQQSNPSRQVKAWDTEIASAAEELTRMRGEYLRQLTPIFFTILADLICLSDLKVTYSPGWDKDRSLLEVFEAAFHRDAALGYTQYGPHRADILIKVNNVPVQDVLSRGEQKLLVVALRLAQGMLLRACTDKSCIYLLDDLAAELDVERRRHVVHALAKLQAQVFATAVEQDALIDLVHHGETKVFHVEHGSVMRAA